MGDVNNPKIFVPVTIDKSHITTIGERLYAESIEFVRELANNAYDADATLVNVIIGDDSIEVRDNGSGMDMEGLGQYFNIGSQNKLNSPKSPVYGRDRIGMFGIGKFASLSVCKRFEVLTKKDTFVARVVFDKEIWESGKDEWRLPLELLPPDFRKENGTTVILSGIEKRFDPKDIEGKIVEGTPIKAPHFRVKINNITVTPKSLSGHKIPILEGTPFGVITGEIVIVAESAALSAEPGIEVKVKQVTVKRELFGMETWGKVFARVRGEVNADFLPITSDRTGFLKDTDEYREFVKTMQSVMDGVKAYIHRLTVKNEGRKISKVLKEALQRIYRALAANPDLSPFGAFPVGERAKGAVASAVTPEGGADGSAQNVTPLEKDQGPPKKRKKKPKVKTLTPNAIIKRIKFGDTGVSCVVDSFGENGPEVFTEETTIYLNRDHPLYKRESAKPDTHTLNLARLITQEIAMMKDPKNPRQAFDRQSKLLRDAFTDKA